MTGVPVPAPPRAEMAALLRFHRDSTWTGSIAEGGMGQGTPGMTARGSGGTHVLTWRNEMAVGGGSWSLVEEYLRTPVRNDEP